SRLFTQRRNLIKPCRSWSFLRLKTPDETGQSPFVTHIESSAGIIDGRSNLSFVTNNSRIPHQGLHISVIKLCNAFRIELGKHLSKSRSFTQNSFPGQPCLKTF